MLSNRKPEPGSVLDLANNGDLDSAIFQLNTILEEQRTEADRFGGAQALIFRQDWLTPQRRGELEEALSLLQPLVRRLGGDSHLCYFLGSAYYQLGEFREAAAWFKKAPNSGCTPSKQEMLDLCNKVLKRPREKKSFRAQVKKVWDAFAPIEAELRQQMHDIGDSDERMEKLNDRISDLLDMAMPGVAWYWETDDDLPVLQLEPDLDQIAAMQQQYFMDHAPKAVEDKWFLTVGKYVPFDEDLAEMQQQGGHFSDMDVQINQVNDDSLELVAYHPSLDPEKVTDEAKDAVYEAIFENLGEEVYLGVFRWVKCCGMPPEGPTMKLGQLLPALEAMGFCDREDLDTTLYRRRRSSLTPTVPDCCTEHHWREDIFRAYTMDPRLNLYYQWNESETYAEPILAGTGAIPGFVVFPLKGQTDNPPVLMAKLLQELDNTMNEENALVLGNAEGLLFGYLDLLAWTLQPALNTVADLLRKHNLPWACWHTFYTPDRTVQLY